MGRDIQKAVDEYSRKGFDVLCASDYEQILTIAQAGNNLSNTLFRAIGIAFKAGHTVGYRTALRKARERRSSNTSVPRTKKSPERRQP